MSRAVPIVSILLILFLLPVVPAQQTLPIEESYVLDPESFNYVTLNLTKSGGVLEIKWDVREDEPIDVYVMNEANFFIYNTSASGFDYYGDGSALSKSSGTTRFKAEDLGVYYIVLDNMGTVEPVGNAYADVRVIVDIRISDVTATPGPGFIEVIAVVGLTALLIRLQRR